MSIIDPGATSKVVIDSLFRKYDVDNSGAIDLEEFRNLIYDLGITDEGIIIERAFEEVDENKNKLISFDEFFAWWKTKEKFKRIDENIYAVRAASDVFSKYDKDRSGFLDVQEFQKCLAEFANSMKQEYEVEQIVKALDKDGDGRISFHEFIAWLNWLK
jgi:Ca2+-binding EF-hand superfamily protein